MTTGVVVLSDVRGSREIADRSVFVRQLKNVLKVVNRDAGSLLGAFEVQAGLDEFAGVVRPGRVGSVILRLWEGLHPVEVRYAIVQGTLDIAPGPEREGVVPGAAGFDGPAFHRATESLDVLRKGNRLVEVQVGASRRCDELLTAVGDLLYGHILGWTERQIEVVRTYRRVGSQLAAARELDVSQSTVSRALAAAEHERFEAARQTFVETLDSISRESAG